MSNIEISNLVLSYKSNNNTSNAKKKKSSTILINIPELTIQKGEIVGFFGPNHVGKSTLLKYIAQIHSDFKILKDSILYDGEKYNKLTVEPRILYVPQDFNSSLFPWLTIEENLRIILKSLKYSVEKTETHVKKFCKEFGYIHEEDLLESLGFYKENENGTISMRDVTELSGGQKQILSILRTIIASPKIIAMDEPFSAVDIYRGKSFRHEIFDYLRGKNITTILVAHTLEEIIKLTDRIFLFNYDKEGGEILQGFEPCDIPMDNDDIEKYVREIKEQYNLEYS